MSADVRSRTDLPRLTPSVEERSISAFRYPLRTTSLAVTSIVLTLLLSTVPAAAVSPEYTLEKIFFGFGRTTNLETGEARQRTFLNLSESYHESVPLSYPYPHNGDFSSFSQIYVEFSSAVEDNDPALGILFSYYVSSSCRELDETSCPLGMNGSDISEDLIRLEIPRILEYRDVDSDGQYTPTDPVVQEFRLGSAKASFASFEAIDNNWSSISVPYSWNSTEINLTQGALFAGDRLLEQIEGFRVLLGNSESFNLTITSYLFLKPTEYNGIPLAPTQLKLDISITNLSYAENDTALAMEVDISSQARFENMTTMSWHSVYTSSTVARSFFNWSTTAQVDGELTPVGSFLEKSNETRVTVYLSYARGHTILHDPVLGMQINGITAVTPGEPEGPSATYDWALIGGLTALAAGVVTIAFIVARRLRRRRDAGFRSERR